MQEETRRHVSTAIHGLIYASELIDQALVGEKRHLDAQKSLQGPFARALDRVAEIVDGASIQDIQKARDDVLFLFGLIRHLRGGFYESMWVVVARAHEVVADLITEQEAKQVLAENACWLDLDARLGHLHPFEQKEDGSFRAYDATYLRGPRAEVRYARYEVEARKRVYDRLKKKLSITGEGGSAS